jgi:hypothetical protein
MGTLRLTGLHAVNVQEELRDLEEVDLAELIRSEGDLV